MGDGSCPSGVMQLRTPQFTIAHAYGEPDVITGLGAKTRMGKPDWHAELSALARDYPGSLEVFFCGPPGLARGVRDVCFELGVGFQQEHF